MKGIEMASVRAFEHFVNFELRLYKLCVESENKEMAHKFAGEC